MFPLFFGLYRGNFKVIYTAHIQFWISYLHGDTLLRHGAALRFRLGWSRPEACGWVFLFSIGAVQCRKLTKHYCQKYFSYSVILFSGEPDV